jgi:DNA replication protein DnaC
MNCNKLLMNLKLRRMLEIYDEQLRAADKDDISYSEFVTRLVRAQNQARQEGALEWRIRRANLPERWSLETFPFARQPGVNRKEIRGFAELEFITKAENIVLVGETGRGKTGLACSLLLKALENRYRCQFVKAQDLSTRCMPRWRIDPRGLRSEPHDAAAVRRPRVSGLSGPPPELLHSP